MVTKPKNPAKLSPAEKKPKIFTDFVSVKEERDNDPKQYTRLIQELGYANAKNRKHNIEKLETRVDDLLNKMAEAKHPANKLTFAQIIKTLIDIVKQEGDYEIFALPTKAWEELTKYPHKDKDEVMEAITAADVNEKNKLFETGSCHLKTIANRGQYWPQPMSIVGYFRWISALLIEAAPSPIHVCAEDAYQYYQKNAQEIVKKFQHFARNVVKTGNHDHESVCITGCIDYLKQSADLKKHWITPMSLEKYFNWKAPLLLYDELRRGGGREVNVEDKLLLQHPVLCADDTGECAAVEHDISALRKQLPGIYLDDLLIVLCNHNGASISEITRELNARTITRRKSKFTTKDVIYLINHLQKICRERMGY